MISKNTNKNGVKLLFSFAVVAIALVGLAILPAFMAGSDAVVKETEADFEIKNVEDLFTFANNVNQGKDSYSGKTVRLAADINLAGKSWDPIGQSGSFGGKTGYRFAGTFDGAGYSIYNMTVDKWVAQDTLEDGVEAGCYASGFFGFIDEDSAVIKDVNFVNANVSGHHWVGVVAGHMTGAVENCHVFDSTITNTHQDANACGDKTGAIIGFANIFVNMIDCTASDCSVIGARNAGQLCGYGYEQTTLNGCAAFNVEVEEVPGNVCDNKDAGEGIRNELVGTDKGCKIIGDVKVSKDLVFTEDIKGNYVLMSEKISITINEGCSFDGSIIFGENKIAFSSLKAGVGGLTIVPGSLMIQGVIDASSEVVITASGDIKIDDVTVDSSTTSTEGLIIKSDGSGDTSVKVVGHLMVSSGAKLVIEDGAKVSVQDTGSITVGSDARMEVQSADDLSLEGDMTVYGVLSGDVEDLIEDENVTMGDGSLVIGPDNDSVMRDVTFHEIDKEVVGEEVDPKPYTVTEDMTIRIADKQTGVKTIILADGVTVKVIGKKDTDLKLVFWVGEETESGIRYSMEDNNLLVQKPTDGSITITADYNESRSAFILNGDVDVYQIRSRYSENVSIKEDSSLTISGIIDEAKEIVYGVKVREDVKGVSAKYILYSIGAIAPKVELSAPGDKVVVKNGSIEVQQGSSIVKMENVVSEKGITVYYGEGMPTIGGIATDGTLTIKTGVFAKNGDGLSGTGCTFNFVQNTISDDDYYTSEVVEKIGKETVGNAVVFGTIEQKKDLGVENDLVITLGAANGSKYIIPEGRVLGNEVRVNSTNGNVIVHGTVMGCVYGAGYVLISPTGFIMNLGAKTPTINIIDGIYSDSKVSGSLKGVETDDKILAYNDLREDGSSTVPAGETYTIEGLFGLNGQTLRVEGTLVIADGAEIFDVGRGSIVIGEKGSIVINGTFAKMMPIEIATDDSDCIMVTGVEGMQISKVGGVLAVSGEISSVEGSVISEVYLGSNAVVSGDLKIAEDVSLGAHNVVVEDKSVLTINGTFYGQVSAEKDATIEMNGKMTDGAIIEVKTGETGTMSVGAENGSITGFVIDVTSMVKEEKIIYIPYLSGDVKSYDADDSANMVIIGDFAVAEDSVLNVDSTVVPEFDSIIAISGFVSIVDSEEIGTYEGAMYTKTEKVGIEDVVTYYYTTLEAALEQIASADKMTVSINMEEIDTSFTLEEKQILKSDMELKIASESVVVVKDGAKIDAQIASVSGKLVVGKKASVSTPASYDAEYVDGTSTVYAGLAVAIRESDGSTPIVVTDSSVDGDLVIDGTKVLEVTGKLDVKGDLIIEEGATLVGGIIIVAGGEDGSKVNIYGILDVTDGVFSAENAKVTVYGTLVSSSEVVGINAAMYSADSKFYYTDIVTAVGSGKDVIVYGKNVESETVTIAAGKKITIDASADVEISKIVLSAGSSVKADGALKAIISTNSASVKVDGKVEMADVVAKEKNAAYASVTTIDGKFDVLDGTVVIEAEVALDQSEFAIDTDAEVVVAEGAKLSVGGEDVFVIDGKLTINGGFVAKDISVVGDLEINNNSTVDRLTVLGNVVVAKDKILAVEGNVIVGSYAGTGANGAVVGHVSVSGDNMIKAYAGSDLSKADVPKKKTTYYVNGMEFVTIYTNGKVDVTTPLGVDDIAQIPGVVVPADGKITWVKEDGTPILATTYIGSVEVVKTTLASQTVTANVYVQDGIELHLGYGFYYTEGKVQLAIGPNDAYGTSADGKSVIVKVFVNGVEVPVVNNKVDITVDMVGQQVVVQASYETPAPVVPEKPTEDYVVSTSVAGDKVVISVISLDGGYLVAGTEVTVTFTVLQETTAFGQTVYKPVEVTKTITIGDDKPTIENETYQLAEILGDEYAVINVVSTVGTTNFGNMTLDYKA